MIALCVAALLAGSPDKSITVAIPGGGSVSSVTLSSQTFNHLVILPGPIGGPVAGAELTATLAPRGTRVLLEGALYSQGSFSTSAEPFASLKEKSLALVPSADGSVAAYSFDRGKSWRLLFLDPLVACRHHSWPSSALALAVPPADELEAILTSAHAGRTLEGIEMFESRESEEAEALSWALAHLTPRLAAAIDSFLVDHTAELRFTRWATESPDAEISAALPALRRALAADPALKKRVLDAARREPPAERAPSMLARIAGTAPMMIGGLEPREGGTIRIYGRAPDGGWASAPQLSLAVHGGRFEVHDLDAGHYVFVFAAEGFKSSTQELELPHFNFSLTLQPAKSLAGDVFQADGGPLRGAEVVVEEQVPARGALPVRGKGRTDEHGHFEISSWAGQEERLLVTPAGSKQCYQWAMTSKMRFSAPAARLRYQVSHRSGSEQVPSVGLEVVVWPMENFGRAHAPCSERRGITDTTGTVDLEGAAEDNSWYEGHVGFSGKRGLADGGSQRMVQSGRASPIQFPIENTYGAPSCR
jgi:hypothetical protein